MHFSLFLFSRVKQGRTRKVDALISYRRWNVKNTRNCRRGLWKADDHFSVVSSLLLLSAPLAVMVAALFSALICSRINCWRAAVALYIFYSIKGPLFTYDQIVISIHSKSMQSLRDRQPKTILRIFEKLYRQQLSVELSCVPCCKNLLPE